MDQHSSGRRSSEQDVEGGLPQRRPVTESILSSLVACHECDLLHEKVVLEVGAVARCVRCNATLYVKKENSLQSQT